jgi:hypothetical protein
MQLNAEDRGCYNWERKSRGMMMRGRHDLSGCGVHIDDGEVSFRNKKERRKNQQKKKTTANKQKEQKQANADMKSKRD